MAVQHWVLMDKISLYAKRNNASLTAGGGIADADPG
jgi:hypothetical protein